MNVTFWSDFNCPNSYIGLKRLTDAAKELDLDYKLDMKPFELYPTLFDEPTNSMTTQFILKYGMTPEKASEEISEVEKIAKKDGLNINYKDLQISSSRNAHRLFKYVKNNHPESSNDIIFKIFEANFVKNSIIADINVLVEIATEMNLDEDEIRGVLESDSYDFEVQLDEEEAISMGVEAIPLYIVSIKQEQLTIPGAYEKEYFKIALEDMINGEIESKTFL